MLNKNDEIKINKSIEGIIVEISERLPKEDKELEIAFEETEQITFGIIKNRINNLLSDLELYFSKFEKQKISKSKRIFNLKKSQLRYILEKCSIQADVEKIRLHDFRHSHASYLLFIQADITAISKRLGHDNLQTTINTYSHLYKDANKQLMKKLNNNSWIIDI